MKRKKIINIYLLSCIAALCFYISVFNCFAQKQGQERIDSLLEKLSKTKIDTSRIKLLNVLAFTYYSINPDEGIKRSEESRILSERINWNSGIIDAYSNLGVCYWMKNDLPKAQQYFFKALIQNENVAGG